MTNEEAYDVISEMTHLNLLTPRESEALQMALKVLESFLPQKPKVIDGEKLITYVCPKCHCIVKHIDKISNKSYYYTRSYSNECYCGQEIDWSEENANNS